jgi:hypothetical protein
VTIVDVKWHGSDVIELIREDSTGKLGSELLYRDREPTLGIATASVPRSFYGDGALFCLASEAYRIRITQLTAVRLKVEEDQLVDVFGEIGFHIDGLQGA